MTPMKRLQNNFKELKNETKHIVSYVTLNKSEPHWNPFGGDGYGDYTKGVKNDFTKIISPLDKKNDITCSFVINYMGNEKETFLAQIKKENNETIKSTKILNYEEFKTKLNLFIKEIKENNKKKLITYPELIKIFSNIYLSEDLDLNKEAKIAEKELMDFLKEPQQELTEKRKKYLDSRKLVEQIEQKINDEIKESPEQKKIEKLLKEIEDTKKIIKNNKEKLEDDNDLKKLKNDLKLNESNFLKIEKSFETQKKEKLKEYPKSIGILIK